MATLKNGCITALVVMMLMTTVASWPVEDGNSKYPKFPGSVEQTSCPQLGY